MHFPSSTRLRQSTHRNFTLFIDWPKPIIAALFPFRRLSFGPTMTSLPHHARSAILSWQLVVDVLKFSSSTIEDLYYATCASELSSVAWTSSSGLQRVQKILRCIFHFAKTALSLSRSQLISLLYSRNPCPGRAPHLQAPEVHSKQYYPFQEQAMAEMPERYHSSGILHCTTTVVTFTKVWLPNAGAEPSNCELMKNDSEEWFQWARR